MSKVQDRHSVKRFAKVRDHVVLQGPNILAQTVGYSPVDGEDRAWNSTQNRDENEPVIEAEIYLDGEHLESQAKEDEEAGYDTHDDSNVVVTWALITDRNATYRISDVLSNYAWCQDNRQ